MTREHLAIHIGAELERAGQALRAAEQLLNSNLPYDAASRAYYAAFHGARAVCLAEGESPRSHKGVAHVMALQLVRTGRLPPETSRRYAVLQRYREASDYDASFVLDSAGAREAVEHARALLALFRELLEREADRR